MTFNQYNTFIYLLLLHLTVTKSSQYSVSQLKVTHILKLLLVSLGLNSGSQGKIKELRFFDFEVSYPICLHYLNF